MCYTSRNALCLCHEKCARTRLYICRVCAKRIRSRESGRPMYVLERSFQDSIPNINHSPRETGVSGPSPPLLGIVLSDRRSPLCRVVVYQGRSFFLHYVFSSYFICPWVELEQKHMDEKHFMKSTIWKVILALAAFMSRLSHLFKKMLINYS